jgi:hypothetical protein
LGSFGGVTQSIGLLAPTLLVSACGFGGSSACGGSGSLGLSETLRFDGGARLLFLLASLAALHENSTQDVVGKFKAALRQPFFDAQEAALD